MDEAHLLTAARYVSLNPVRARLVGKPQDWPWPSVRAHLDGADDGLVSVKPLLERVGDVAGLLAPHPRDAELFQAIRRSENSGRPLAAEDLVKDLERRLGRIPFALNHWRGLPPPRPSAVIFTHLADRWSG